MKVYLENISNIKTWPCVLLLLSMLFMGTSLNAQQPQLLKDINPGAGFSYPYGYIAYDGRVFFVANDGIHGWELWVSDGTEAGTYMFKDINPGSGWSDPSYFKIYNNKLYFSANDGVHGQEVWVTDGTQAGTYMIKDINTSGNNSDYYPPQGFIVYDGQLFFGARDGIHGYELWVTDGTATGTYMVKDINPGPAESKPLDFTEYNGKLYFRADDGTHGQELWVTDGTETGTQMVKDIHPGPSDSYLAGFTEYKGKLYLRADDGTHGAELWVTDGSEAGTYMLKDIYPGTLGGCGAELILFNGKLYFKGYVGGEDNFDLWMTDGTEAGTQPVGIENLISFQWLFEHDNKIYFNGRHPTYGRVLWATDGTVVGTEVFAQASFPSSFTTLSDKLYFISDNKHIWVTDGTQVGTYGLIPPGADMPVGDPSLQTHNLALCNGLLYYTACYFIGVGCEPYFINHSLSVNAYENGRVYYWPNPFTDELHLESIEPIEKVNIYNLKGQELVSSVPGALREILMLSHLPAGIYFMEIHTKNGRETIKLVKRP